MSKVYIATKDDINVYVGETAPLSDKKEVWYDTERIPVISDIELGGYISIYTNYATTHYGTTYWVCVEKDTVNNTSSFICFSAITPKGLTRPVDLVNNTLDEILNTQILHNEQYPLFGEYTDEISSNIISCFMPYKTDIQSYATHLQTFITNKGLTAYTDPLMAFYFGDTPSNYWLNEYTPIDNKSGTGNYIDTTGLLHSNVTLNSTAGVFTTDLKARPMIKISGDKPINIFDTGYKNNSEIDVDTKLKIDDEWITIAQNNTIYLKYEDLSTTDASSFMYISRKLRMSKNVAIIKDSKIYNYSNILPNASSSNEIYFTATNTDSNGNLIFDAIIVKLNSPYVSVESQVKLASESSFVITPTFTSLTTGILDKTNIEIIDAVNYNKNIIILYSNFRYVNPEIRLTYQPGYTYPQIELCSYRMSADTDMIEEKFSIPTSNSTENTFTYYQSNTGDSTTVEKIANKVTSLSAQSTDVEYPSAKCVYDMIGDVESALSTINTALEDLIGGE